MDFSSRLLENAVHEISRLPGIGRRTALRMVLYLLKQPEKTTISIIKSLPHEQKSVTKTKEIPRFYKAINASQWSAPILRRDYDKSGI